MTGNDLKQIMEKLNLTGADVGSITGVSRAYVCQLLSAPEDDIPSSTVSKLRSGFLTYHRDVAGVYFDLTGEFCEGTE